MRLRDVKIGMQLGLGLGLILILTGSFALFSWFQGDHLWQQTRNLYEHPLAVRQALSEFQADILCMHKDLKDLCLIESESNLTAAKYDIEQRQSDAYRQLEILRDRYLGPVEDVVRTRLDLDKWGPLREETIRLLGDGKRAEATARTMALGVDGLQMAALMADFQSVSEFARRKADSYYRDAEKLSATLAQLLFAVMAVILLSCLFVAAVLLRGVRRPLADLTTATTLFHQGNLDARSTHVSANEFGVLAGAFTAMADTIRNEIQGKERSSQLTGAMFRNDEAHEFCRELLKALLAHTDSHMGAVYLLDAEKRQYVHFESIGLDKAGRTAFSATALEGELGLAVASRQIQRITDIPSETRFTFTAVSGRILPREIVTIPVISGDEVTAIVSLASVRTYSEAAAQLLDNVWSVLTARMNSVLARQRIQYLAEHLEAQNRELDAQKSELSSQASELATQNTELESQKQAITEVNRQKSVFMANMSHELRTPLNSVIALSGVLHRRFAGKIPDEEYGYLEVIERNGRNLLGIINDILDLSRIEAGREELRIQPFAIDELLKGLIPVLEPLAREKGLVLEVCLPANLPLVRSDPVKCSHILQNLVANAVKFTEQGKVTIFAAHTGDALEICVRDTGIGIAESKQEIIFQEFRQADESTSRKYGGSGLGLAIARKYARMLGGDLAVRSTLGEGATFTLQLPMTEARAAAANEPTPYRRSPSVAAPAGRGQHILVVEDNETAIIQLTGILKAGGYRVDIARDGKIALEFIAQHLPDAVVLDLMMPEVDGFQVLKELRSSPRTASLPVLILTARQVTREELSFLTGNHVHQLIQKGDINRAGLLAVIAELVAPMAIC